MGVVLVGGVHGVGKTTSIESARSMLTKEVPVLKGSEIMARILGVTTEDLPHVDPERRNFARQVMYDELRLATNGVRDCHYCTYSDTGYEFPFATSADIGRAAVAVLIEASVDVVHGRRLSIARRRPTDIAVIREQIELEREGADQAARRLGIPLKIINNDDDLQLASSELATVFDAHIE
jgi:adenylate kinase